MTSKEALKRIRQETAPATYMADFDKNECCDIIDNDLEVLEIIKAKRVDIDKLIIYNFNWKAYNNSVEQYRKLHKLEIKKLKEWLKNEH